MKIDEIPRRVHFVGVGGVGMSGLAEFLVTRGYSVTGSDRVDSDRTRALSERGVKIHIGHNAENVGDAELVVRTSAVPTTNVEVVQATTKNIPVVLREQLLGAVFDSFQTRIAVCGTHGKTTVTAMIHQVLQGAQIDHAAFIGGVYHGCNYFDGDGTVVAEACEFNRSFLNLHPTVCVCLNAEHDHPDCYATEEDVRRAFAEFFVNVDPSGCVLLPHMLKNLVSRRKKLLFDRAVPLENIVLSDGKPRFDALLGDSRERIELNVVGMHNAYNAQAVLALSELLHLPRQKVAQALAEFDGVDRRWTEKVNSVCLTVVDYAHHPTEIACSVAAARSVSKGRVLCVFQPHTFSRTQAFWQEFADCFRQADAVAYLPIYSAREKPIAGVNSFLLAQSAIKSGLNACFLPDFDSARCWIHGNATKDDILLILGAGDVACLADRL